MTMQVRDHHIYLLPWQGLMEVDRGLSRTFFRGHRKSDTTAQRQKSMKVSLLDDAA